MARKTWTDHKGIIHWEIDGRHPLNFKYNSHAALRAYVFVRDRFSCQRCGVAPGSIPVDYDGRYMPECCGVHLYLDHIISRSSGGTSHPNNLQVLCHACNSIKCSKKYDFRDSRTKITG